MHKECRCDCNINQEWIIFLFKLVWSFVWRDILVTFWPTTFARCLPETVVHSACTQSITGLRVRTSWCTCDHVGSWAPALKAGVRPGNPAWLLTWCLEDTDAHWLTAAASPVMTHSVVAALTSSLFCLSKVLKPTPLVAHFGYNISGCWLGA